MTTPNLLTIALVGTCAVLAGAAPGEKPAPTPEPAIPAVARLFDRYQVVGLSDLHGCTEVLAFVGQLVREPEFLDRVNDITWEPGNARFQGLMDEFILRGANLSRQELSPCWRNNTQAHTYSDTPALFDLLRTIRDVNLKRPEGKRLRVLLIDPPVDWSRIRGRQDIRPKDFDRERHMADVLEAEVYAKGRKALFFAGGAHLGRWAADGGAADAADDAGPTILPFDGAKKPAGDGGADGLIDPKAAPPVAGAPGGLVGPSQSLERHHPGTTFNITIHEGFGPRTPELERRLEGWPKPALARLHGTWWGELTPAPGGDVFVRRDGRPVKAAPARKLEERWDAVLFLGRRHELTRVEQPGPDVLDDAWLNELDRRHQITGGPPRAPQRQPSNDRGYFPGEAE